MYKSEYFDKIILDTKWTPDGSFYKKAFEVVVASSLSNDGWYESERKSEEFKFSLSKDQFSFLWNTYKANSLREGLITLLTEGEPSRSKVESSVSKYNTEILSLLYSKIPVDFEVNSNRARASFAEHLGKDFDYLSEVNKAKIANKEDIMGIWSRAGMDNSNDKSFYNYLWSLIKREKGSVEKRMEIVRSSIGRGILSKKIISHCAKRGTKRVKRTTVDYLSSRLHDAKRREEEDLSAMLEEALLLFATTDDASVVDTLSESLSVDNLPWVMPSASKFPWLLRRISERIDWARDS